MIVHDSFTGVKMNYRYEKCEMCGEVWNVSVQAPKGRYICPKCRTGKDLNYAQKERTYSDMRKMRVLQRRSPR